MSGGFVFTKAVKNQEKLRLALDGTAGSGKTWTALTLGCHLARLEGGRVALIDSERSSAKKYAHDFDFDHLTLPDFGPYTYMGAIRAAIDAGYAVIIIDSFSHAWTGVLAFKDEVTARSKSNNSYTEGWREATPVHDELVDTVLRAPAHVIATLRTKTDYVITDGRPEKVGLKPIQREGVDFEFDVVGDMTPENSMIVSKTRCSRLTGRVIRKPGADLADTLYEWLTDGEELLGAAEAAAIRDELNELGGAARRAWRDHFAGIKPADLPAARREEALAFLDQQRATTTTQEGAGADGPDRGGDAGRTPDGEGDPVALTSDTATPGDGADGHDVGRTEPEPAPATPEGEGSEPPPSGSGPPPATKRKPVDKKDVAILADVVFLEAATSAPTGKKTAAKQALRYALTWTLTEGRAQSLDDLDPDGLHEVHAALEAIKAGRRSFTVDFAPVGGAAFDFGAEPVPVLWSELTIDWPQAPATEPEGAPA